MKKKLSRRIELLERLRVDMEAKYGASDVLVLDLLQEVASLRSKSTEVRSRFSPHKADNQAASKAA